MKAKIGDKFGKLEIISDSPKNNRKETMWCCKCECGKIKNIKQYNLIKGKTKSCGCVKTGTQRRNKHKIGKYNDYLEITKIEWSEKYRCPLLHYKCICGNIGKSHKRLRTSCGCMQKRVDFGYHQEIRQSYWNSIISQAKQRNFDFSITIEYIWELFIRQNRKCKLTGVEIFFNGCDTGKSLRTASLDRIDSNKGYVEGNVQWVHKKVNKLKMDLEEKELLYWSKLIYEQSCMSDFQISGEQSYCSSTG